MNGLICLTELSGSSKIISTKITQIFFNKEKYTEEPLLLIFSFLTYFSNLILVIPFP